ncbi:MAG: aminotransferase class V-fold PLP-dependent enzyme [Bacteroidetes bacterium]|jgi:selenocysteine lyase/cysteine desulfurase|nr:aminotransferase class V-fold PLP-dependent enzyme [Bacteroidota bacterium]
MNHSELRQHFPHAEHELYVNHAATSPLSRPVMDAIDAYLGERHGARPGAPIDNFEAFMPILAEARERAGTVLGTTAERVAFMPNTSAALNVLAEGLDWQPGDRIALPGCEFPTNVYPFLNLEDRGVAVDFIPHEEGTFTLEAIEETLTPDTRLLSLSWVQFLSGFRADLDAVGALCDAHDVLFCVDAIQGLGALELDVEAAGIDFLACGGHKWLMATQGIGLLYCTEALQDRIRPPAGWLHGPVDWEHLDDYELAFHPEARRYEIGTRNNVGIAALHAALGLYLDAGPAWCEQQVRARADQLAEGLRALGFARYGSSDPAHSAGIVTIRTEAPDTLFDHLQAHDITAALRNRLVRFAPTYYNTPGEMERILTVVEAFATASSAAPN